MKTGIDRIALAVLSAPYLSGWAHFLISSTPKGVPVREWVQNACGALVFWWVFLLLDYFIERDMMRRRRRRDEGRVWED